MSNDMRSRQLCEFTVGTLAALTAALCATKVDSSRLNGCTIKKIRFNTSFFGKTAGANEGPIAYGLSRGMTTAEIAECFAADPQSRQDTDELDKSKRPLMVLGVVGQAEVSSDTGGGLGTLMRNATFPWREIIEGDNFHHFIFNLNPANAMATEMLLQIYSEFYGDWLSD